MSITFTINGGKQIKQKATETLGDLLDNSGVNGKFLDLDFLVNGQPLQGASKGAKLGQLFAGQQEVQIQILKKGQGPQPVGNFGQVPQQNFVQPPSPFVQQNQAPQAPFGQQPQPSFGQAPNAPFGQQNQAPQAPFGQPQAPFGQPQAPFGQPQAPFGQPPQQPAQQPASQIQNQQQAKPQQGFPFSGAIKAQGFVVQNQQSARKQVELDQKRAAYEEKLIEDQFMVTISEDGNKVELVDQKNDFRAIFLEENAKPEKTQDIKQQLLPNLYLNDASHAVKLIVGKQQEYTKVIFKKDFNGIAIQWATGVYTLFDYYIQV